jgi:hypothetical protein
VAQFMAISSRMGRMAQNNHFAWPDLKSYWKDL